MPPGSQHPGDLDPPRGDRMAADDEVERRVGERQRRLVVVGHHGDAARVQQRGGLGQVRRPALGGDHQPWERPRLGEHLAAAGLDVERRGRRPDRRAARPSPGRSPTTAAARWPARRASRSPSRRPALLRPRRRARRTIATLSRASGTLSTARRRRRRTPGRCSRPSRRRRGTGPRWRRRRARRGVAAAWPARSWRRLSSSCISGKWAIMSVWMKPGWMLFTRMP